MTRLWAFDQLSSRPSGIGCPPRETEGVDDYLPAATAEGENTTEAIAEQTMGPMLIWAIRMVEDFSDDILTAWAEMERLRAAAAANKSTPASLASLKAFMEPLLAGDLPIPAVTWRGKPALARAYIAAITGASHNQVTATSKRLGWRGAARGGAAARAAKQPILSRAGGGAERGAPPQTTKARD
ncbi:hypothetical protein ACFW4T_28075 [Streptomyces mutabilis]|uniref:hypothetical protein n=1 Tax=Streptomyces mutabilis TaxID=67332 RepID=UPI003693815D